MHVLSTSPTSIRVFDVNIANALGSSEAATILQQLHYWMQKEKIGVVVDGVKYVYNTFRKWVKEQFIYLSDSKFIKAMDILRNKRIVKVIRYRAKHWDQTNYYSLDYQKLREWAKAESIEISELSNSVSQDDETQVLEMQDPEVSYKESKSTTKEKTTKQDYGDRLSVKSRPVAAATSKKALEGKKTQKHSNASTVHLTADSSQNKAHSKATQSNSNKEKNAVKVDHIINLGWKELIPELDSVGVPTNKTIKDLLKLYPADSVENAIALLKARKRDSHIPNPSGYFVSALKGDWASKTLVGHEGDLNLDTAAVFRHWYDLARELGYCSGQEVREGEQWICLSGAWETWESATARGYDLNYLKKIMKRNKGG